MGIDAGFDFVPRLSKSAEDKRRWRFFVNCVKEEYEDDNSAEVKANYIEFNAGEHPMLPFDGNKFLRFSSKISGKTGTQAHEYIIRVAGVATSIFGSRVERWSEMNDEYGFYGAVIEIKEILGSLFDLRGAERLGIIPVRVRRIL